MAPRPSAVVALMETKGGAIPSTDARAPRMASTFGSKRGLSAATDTSIWDPMDPDSDPGLPDRSAMLDPDDVADAVLFVATRPEYVQIPVLQIERA